MAELQRVKTMNSDSGIFWFGLITALAVWFLVIFWQVLR